ncbi:MAG: hypothetical protein J5800_05950 [Spirochaetales bacterium]|nr:hypothetical protein [Spirochaetales bacterium]
MSSSSDKYLDIIDMPYRKSDRYPHMPESDRAAQFAPFAALVGFGDLIKEVAKKHEERFDASYKDDDPPLT